MSSVIVAMAVGRGDGLAGLGDGLDVVTGDVGVSDGTGTSVASTASDSEDGVGDGEGEIIGARHIGVGARL